MNVNPWLSAWLSARSQGGFSNMFDASDLGFCSPIWTRTRNLTTCQSQYPQVTCRPSKPFDRKGSRQSGVPVRHGRYPFVSGGINAPVAVSVAVNPRAPP